MRAILLCVWLSLAAPAWAQFRSPQIDVGAPASRESVQRFRVGISIKAVGGICYNIIATAGVPDDWPEQSAKIVKEDVSSSVKSLTYRTLTGGGGVKQMVVEIDQLLAGQESHALLTFEVRRSAFPAPDDTTKYVIPKKLDRTLNVDVGSSPFIESRHPKVVAAAKEATADKETDWQKVEALYDWTRDHVKYVTDEQKGAARTIFDKEGGADDVTSVFIALCRSIKIPARTVFVPGHCYAEFYLESEPGEGQWFPCQLAGQRAFGTIEEQRPILQKGDNFKNPENGKERLRYVTQYLNVAGKGKPEVKFTSEIVAE